MAGYKQEGSKNNNWKGDKAEYSAKHKRRANETGNHKRGKKCSRCSSTTGLQSVTVHGSGGDKFITLCTSCHSKYDKKENNFKKESSMKEGSLLKFAKRSLQDDDEMKALVATGWPYKKGDVLISENHTRGKLDNAINLALGAGAVGSLLGGPVAGAVAAPIAGAAGYAMSASDRMMEVLGDTTNVEMKGAEPSETEIAGIYSTPRRDAVRASLGSKYNKIYEKEEDRDNLPAKVIAALLGTAAGGLGGGALASHFGDFDANDPELWASVVTGAGLGGGASYYGASKFEDLPIAKHTLYRLKNGR